MRFLGTLSLLAKAARRSLAGRRPLQRSDLPVFGRVEEGLRNGRNLREGYARGWGIQFGGLADQAVRDPLYREAVALARGRTVVAEENRINLFLILKFHLAEIPPGAIVEFGAYRGGSALFMAHVARALLPGTRVYSLDTFEGMPQPDPAVDSHGRGDLASPELAELREYAARQGLDNLEFVPGLFQDTAPALLARVGNVSLVHVDCDIRSSVAYAYDVSRPYLVDGAYVVFDDALYSSCLGATEAVESLVIRRDALNSEQVYPHFVFRVFKTLRS